MAVIHPSAIVASGATIDDSAEIGPYCVIGPNVRIGARTRLMSHVNVDGWTTLGEDCIVFPFASLGTQTQDLKYKGGAPRVEIGNKTTIREYVTVNAATFDGDATRVGSNCHIMAYAHIAHDCQVGNGVIMANCATLAGHVIVEDQVGIGGMAGVHQFVRLGRLCYLGGMTKASQDIPPFMIADGNPIAIHTINAEGLKRRGISEESQQLLKKAYKILYREGLSTRQAMEKLETELEQNPEVQYLVSFIKNSERGITK
jgi:UDP-N-acetylglucosamine acyltransferase